MLKIGLDAKGSHQKKQEQNFTTVVNYLPLFHNNFSHFHMKINVFLQLLRVCEWGRWQSLSQRSLSSQALNKQIMKSFHLSGPKFDIAVEMFCVVKFSNFLLSQKFITVKFGANFMSEFFLFLSIPLFHRLLIIAKKTLIFKFRNLLKLSWNRGAGVLHFWW